jgi:hypothetical protein
MKETKITFKLERAAKKAGGDRYLAQGKIDGFTIYIPQEISRPLGKPVNLITITFETED